MLIGFSYLTFFAVDVDVEAVWTKMVSASIQPFKLSGFSA
jgi:hypothetical protein